MIKKTLIVLLALVVALGVVIQIQPSTYSVTRSTTINAPPQTVFAQVNDFHKWDAWSPWAKLDPGMKQSFEGPAAGTGSIYRWAGNKQVGEGQMTITESQPNDLIRIRLEFLKPFASVGNTEFSFKPQGNQTLVTWTMSGSNNFIAKAFNLVMSMDKMIGGDFEKGLAQMKSVSEAAPKP